MKKGFKIAFVLLFLLGIGSLITYSLMNHGIYVMEPKGNIGHQEKDIIITSSLLMMIVVIPVMVLTWAFAWRYREGKHKGKHTPDWEHNNLAEYCWWGVPLIIVGILSIITWRTSHTLNPFRPLDSDVKPIKIQVVALEWKWLFLYPEQGIATVNYLQFPEKTPLNFEITSDAPMNSFWIPQLGGQIYAMPAMRAKLHLIADEPGTFRGKSASFSGKGFAGMHFPAVSVTSEEFNQWVAKVKSSPDQMGWASYQKLLVPSENHPKELFVLTDPNLFEQVLNKYRIPPEKE